MDALRSYSASPSPSLEYDSSEKEENDVEKPSEQESAVSRHNEVVAEHKPRPKKGDRVRKEPRSLSPPEQYRRDRHHMTASSKRNRSPVHKADSRGHRRSSPHRDSREHRRSPPHSRTSREERRHSSPPQRGSRGRRHSPPPHHHHSHRHRSRSPHDRRRSQSPKPAKSSFTSGSSSTKPPSPPSQPVWSDDVSLTPEQKLEQALATARALGPKLVPFSQPGEAHPTAKFQSVMEKRKLLWKKDKKVEKSFNNWEVASFEGDEQGMAQSKFRRLMGIKRPTDSTENPEAAEKMKKDSCHLLDQLEKQYELSRFKTHMAKGVGLGYGSSTLPTIPSTSTGTDDLLESNH